MLFNRLFSCGAIALFLCAWGVRADYSEDLLDCYTLADGPQCYEDNDSDDNSTLHNEQDLNSNDLNKI